MSKSSHLHGTWISRHKELLIIIIIKIAERSLYYHRNKIYMHKNKGYEERRKLRHLFQVKYHFKVLTLLCLISKKEVFWRIRCCKLNQLRTVESNNFNLDKKKRLNNSICHLGTIGFAFWLTKQPLCLDSQFPFFIMSVSDDLLKKRLSTANISLHQFPPPFW